MRNRKTKSLNNENTDINNGLNSVKVKPSQEIQKENYELATGIGRFCVIIFFIILSLEEYDMGFIIMNSVILSVINLIIFYGKPNIFKKTIYTSFIIFLLSCAFTMFGYIIAGVIIFFLLIFLMIYQEFFRAGATFFGFIGLIFWDAITGGNSMSKPALAKDNLLDCQKETAENKGICVEDTINNLQDSRIQRCTEGNIDEKKSLADNLKNNKITDAEIKDIDGLIKECMYYKASKNNLQNSTDYPVLSSFVSSAAGSFVGNYLANNLFSNISNYNNPDNCTSYKYDNGIYTCSNSLGISTTRSYSQYRSADTSSKNTNLNKVDTQYKTDSWNIKSMKSNSASLSNYKLGDTGKSRSNTSKRSSSTSSWTSSKSSSSSSWSSSFSG